MSHVQPVVPKASPVKDYMTALTADHSIRQENASGSTLEECIPGSGKPAVGSGIHESPDLELSTTTTSEITMFPQSPPYLNSGETPEKTVSIASPSAFPFSASLKSKPLLPQKGIFKNLSEGKTFPVQMSSANPRIQITPSRSHAVDVGT